MKYPLALRAKVLVLITIYVITWIFQSLPMALQSDAFANIKKVDTNLVAVLVDRELYDHGDFQNRLQRYTTQYIQSKISNSKAIVFPVDTKVVQAHEIAKMLESLYFDGIQKEPSTLEGIILVGANFPLPVVKDEQAIFPTIFPYTDFDQPKFYRDPTSQYFVPNGVDYAQPEVWHSHIHLGSAVSDYVAFFDKLKNYHTNPNDFVGDNIWYDDFIAQKESFNPEALDSYINKQLFAEDVGNHRYATFLVDFFNQQQNKKTTSLIEEMGQFADANSAADYAAIKEGLNEFSTANNLAVPTLMIAKALQGQFKLYSELYPTTARTAVRDNVITAGRWTNNQIHSHAEKVERVDAYVNKKLDGSTVPEFVSMNKKMENKLVEFFETGQGKDYPMMVPLLTDLERFIDIKTHPLFRPGINYSALASGLLNYEGREFHKYFDYQMYYYGKPASEVKKLIETTIFLGTPSPLGTTDKLGKIADIKNIPNGPAQYLTASSLGVAQGITSQLVEANEGFVPKQELITSHVNPYSELLFCGIPPAPDNDPRKKTVEEQINKNSKQINDTEAELASIQFPNYAEKTIEYQNWIATYDTYLTRLEQIKGTVATIDEAAKLLALYTGVIPAMDTEFDTFVTKANDYETDLRGLNSAIIQNTYNQDDQKYPTEDSFKKKKEDHQARISSLETEIASLTPDTLPWFVKNIALYQEKIVGYKIEKNWRSSVAAGYFTQMVDPQTKKANLEKQLAQLKAVQQLLTMDVQSHFNGLYVKNVLGYNTPLALTGNGSSLTLPTLRNHGVRGPQQDPTILKSRLRLHFGKDNTDQTRTKIDQLVNNNEYSKLAPAGSYFNLAGSTEVTDYQPWMKAEYLSGGFLQRTAYYEIKQKATATFFSWFFSKDTIQKWCDNNKYAFLPSFCKYDLEYSVTTNNPTPTQPSQPISPLFCQVDGLHDLHQDINAILRGESTPQQAPGAHAIAGSGYSLYAKEINSPEQGEYVQFFINNKLIKQLKNTFVKPTVDAQGKQIPQFLDRAHYKLIPGLVVHNAPTSEQVTQFEMTTPSRPIDGKPYLTFLTIGGDWIQLPFPSLYEVPVYKQDPNLATRSVLKSKEEIQSAIRVYLTDVVRQYNDLLAIQNNKSNTYYQSDTALFDALATIDTKASPNRTPYAPLPLDFFNSLLDDNKVAEYAAALYYHNSLLPFKTASTNLANEYDQQRAEINVSQKKGAIIQDYLTLQAENSPLQGLQGYEKNGYELISLNSDGNDAFTNEIAPSWVSEIQNQHMIINNRNQLFGRIFGSDSLTRQDGHANAACTEKFPEPVPLFQLNAKPVSPWGEAFLCWLRNMEIPKVKVTFPASFAELTELFNKDNTNPEASQNLTTAQSATNTTSTNSPQANQGRIQVTAVQQELLDRVSLILPTTYSLLDDAYTTDANRQLLRIQVQQEPNSQNTYDPIEIAIQSAGANCLMVGSTSTCKNNGNGQKWTGKLSTTEPVTMLPVLIPMLNSDKKIVAGDTIVTVTLTDPKTKVSVDQTFVYTVTQGTLAATKIALPYSHLLSASPLILQVQGQDRFNNAVYSALDDLTLTTSTGTFEIGLNRISVENFRDEFVYVAPAVKTSQTVKFSVIDKDQAVRATAQTTLHPGSMQIVQANRFVNTTTKTIDYTLPRKDVVFLLQAKSINLNALPHMTLRLTAEDKKTKLAGPVRITTEQGLFDVYERVGPWDGTNPALEISSTRQVSTLSFDGERDIHLILQPKPYNNVGSDTLLFHYPDGTTERFAITVKPSEFASQIILESTTPVQTLQPGQELKLNVFMRDDWDNVVIKDQSVQITTLGTLQLMEGQQRQIIAGGEGQITLHATPYGGMGYVKVDPIGLSNNRSIISGLFTAQVDQRLFPLTGLNGLYLNLLGSSRGNVHYEQTPHYNIMPRLLTTSKVLASTSEIIAPEHVPITVLTIAPDGTIDGVDRNDWLIVKDGSTLIAQHMPSRTQMKIGHTNDWSWSNDIPALTQTYPENISFVAQSLPAYGSTNAPKLLAIVDRNAVYEPAKNTSVEESQDTSKNIGWRHIQQHLVQFGQGKSIGEATLSNSSEFLINYGDPLITRKSQNPTITPADLDAGPGQLIVSDATKTIKKALSIDVNADGLLDVVTVFDDGAVIRSKQYGGQDNIFVDMGPLLNIYGSIQEIFGGDVNGDRYGDLIVQTSNNDLRAYLNLNGRFQVDGYPICLDASHPKQLPQRLDHIDQRFLNDMDRDSIMDIVYNKGGKIVIVYGGKSGNGNSYVSQNALSCDPQWQNRQKDFVKVVDNLGLQISPEAVYDTSLIRRQGLTPPEEPTYTIADTSKLTLPTVDLGAMTESQRNNYLQTQPIVPNLSSLPLSSMTSQGLAQLYKRSASPIDHIPVYENQATTKPSDIRYISADQLAASDQITVKKFYQVDHKGILQPGDVVTVKVQISGLRNERLTYIDRIQGAWEVKRQSNGTLQGWNPGTLSSDAIYTPLSLQQGFSFMIDNISLGSNNQVEFSYQLIFQGDSPIKIKLHDRNQDNYDDILLYPQDSCSRYFWLHQNEAAQSQSYRSYKKDFVDLAAKVSKHAQSQTKEQNEHITKHIPTTLDQIQNQASSLEDTFKETMTYFDPTLNKLKNINWNNNQNFIANVNDTAETVASILEELGTSMCNGNTPGCQSCSILPHSSSFLSVGDWNIMGCKPKFPRVPKFFPEDNGMPILAFPANFPNPIVQGTYLPLPWPYGGIFKSTEEEYGYGIPLNGGKTALPSLVRIYVSPTTTMQVGTAICFSPEKLGKKIPPIVRQLMGGCMVFATNSKKTCNPNDNGELGFAAGDDGLSDQDVLDLAEFGVCKQNPVSSGTHKRNTSPLRMSSVSDDGIIRNPYPSRDIADKLAIFNFEKTPIDTTEDSQVGGVVLEGGKVLTPRVLGTKAKGLVQCIIQDGIDRQVNYIVNAMSNMEVGVYLPNLSQLGYGFSDVNKKLQNTIITDMQRDGFWGGLGSNITSHFNTQTQTFVSPKALLSGGNIIDNIRKHRNNKQINPNSSYNPFKMVEQFFQDTPLINIQMQQVLINVPMIHGEDIVRYSAGLRAWLDRNSKILEERKKLGQGVTGLCMAKPQEYEDLEKTPAYQSRKTRKNQKSDTNASQTQIDLLDDVSRENFKGSVNSKLSFLEEVLAQGQTCTFAQTSPTGQCAQFFKTINKTDPQEAKKTYDVLMSYRNSLQKCNVLITQSLGSMREASKGMTSLEKQLIKNIKMLDQYKRFPLQLYQWIHARDRYVNEIVGMVDDVMGYLTNWLRINATRFEQYVDALIAISTAIQTWQAVLDVSINWQKRCSNCTIDTYDIYACSLGPHLCGMFKLPLIKLPPFKIPNVYIDLSHIDLTMDMMLPEFHFVPTAVPLVDLPDLPQPPNIRIADIDPKSIDILLEELTKLLSFQNLSHIPEIPDLPAPPTLGELPGFVPKIEIELPTLPPAPSLPTIAPSLQTAIKAVDFVTRLMCVIKSGFGFIGESDMKSRIESLTQRTCRIPLFDDLDVPQLQYPDDKIDGFDFQIDAYLNFNLRFDSIYRALQSLATQLNTTTDKIVSRNPNKLKPIENLHQVVDSTSDVIERNYTLDPTTVIDAGNNALNNFNEKNKKREEEQNNPQASVNNSILSMIATNEEVEYTTLEDEKSAITQVLTYINEHQNTPDAMKDRVAQLQQTINQKSTFEPKFDQVNTLHREVSDALTQSRDRIQDLASQLASYDIFLDNLQKQHSGAIHRVYTGSDTYYVSLFDNTSQTSLPTRSLESEYLALQHNLLDKYHQGLRRIETPQNKGTVQMLTREIAYLKNGLSIIEDAGVKVSPELKKLYNTHESHHIDYLYYNKQALGGGFCEPEVVTSESTMLASSYDPLEVVNSYPFFNVMAQVSNSATATTQMELNTAQLYDFSKYANNVLIAYPDAGKTKMVDVIRSSYLQDQIQGYSQFDFNADEKKDLLLRTDNQVYIKYANQNVAHKNPTLHTNDTKFYVMPVWDQDDEWSTRTKDTNGYLTVDNLSLKVFDQHLSVKNLQVEAQDYDSFTIEWTSSLRQQNVAGYILEINTIPDAYHLKATQQADNQSKSHYVLFLPEAVASASGYLSLHNQLPLQPLSSLLTGTVLDIVPYDPLNQQLSYSFAEIPRAWYYTRVASLLSSGGEKPIYSLGSPWSHHVVAGQQLIADNQGPIPNVKLIRTKTNTVIHEGLTPEALVNTNYHFDIEWEDVGGVVDNAIMTATGQLIAQFSGGKAILSGLYFVTNASTEYQIRARDYSNNETVERILLTTTIPTMELDEVIQGATGAISVTSLLSEGMDEGIVHFERKRNGRWTTLANPLNPQGSGFAYRLGFNQVVTTGGLFNTKQGLELYHTDGSTIATVDKDTTNVQILPQFEQLMAVKGTVSAGVPALVVYDTRNQADKFIIKPKITDVQLDIKAPYTLHTLAGKVYGAYENSQCILNTQAECMIVIDTNGQVIIQDPYRSQLSVDYRYDQGRTIFVLKDHNGSLIGILSFIALLP